MKNYLIPVLLLSSLLSLGCAQPPLVIGQPAASTSKDEVVIYYIDRPRCNFETLAYIRVTGGYFTLESMLGKMQKQAAGVGADGLYVLHTQQLDVREYLGTAKAIRCLTT
ncbi:MAG: hypothetical protein KJN95_08705 [Gammaproteobacteria bacterium]|nr:hypothetical protein [Gammaproteobacteria bacterium]